MFRNRLQQSIVCLELVSENVVFSRIPQLSIHRNSKNLMKIQ